MTNQVQFTNHAIERITTRYKTVTTYATVQTVLVHKPLRNGLQKVVITTLDKVTKVYDETARNGVVVGKQVKAVVHVTDNNQAEVITVTLE